MLPTEQPVSLAVIWVRNRRQEVATTETRGIGKEVNPYAIEHNQHYNLVPPPNHRAPASNRTAGPAAEQPQWQSPTQQIQARQQIEQCPYKQRRVRLYIPAEKLQISGCGKRPMDYAGPVAL